MSKHTPGPWTHEFSPDEGFLIIADGVIVVACAQTEANARLTSTATELLEALDNLAHIADICELFLRDTHPGKASALRRHVSKAIAVIAKVQGEVK